MWLNQNPQQIEPLSQQGSYSASGGFLTMTNPTEFYTIVNMINVSQFASYDLNMYLYASPAGANLDVVVVGFLLQWYDDLVSGIPVFEEDWWVWAGRAATSMGNNSLAGAGPMHGKYMTVIAFLPSTATGGAVFQYFNLFGSGRSVPYSDWRQNPQTLNPEIFNLTTLLGSQEGTGFDNNLGSVSNFSIAEGIISFIPLALYSGPVYYRFQGLTNAPANNPVILSTQQGVGGTFTAGTGQPNILVSMTADLLEHEGTFLAPRAPCIFIVRASASGPTAISFEAIGQQAA